MPPPGHHQLQLHFHISMPHQCVDIQLREQPAEGRVSNEAVKRTSQRRTVTALPTLPGSASHVPKATEGIWSPEGSTNDSGSPSRPNSIASYACLHSCIDLTSSQPKDAKGDQRALPRPKSLPVRALSHRRRTHPAIRKSAALNVARISMPGRCLTRYGDGRLWGSKEEASFEDARGAG